MDIERQPWQTVDGNEVTRGLTVAVTGPTGTFGFGLVPLLEADERIDADRGDRPAPVRPGRARLDEDDLSAGRRPRSRCARARRFAAPTWSCTSRS